MNKLTAVVAAAIIAGASLPVFAMDNMKMDMKMMDTDGDGMISKDEFMKMHESMYDGMKKNSSGMVSVKDMQMHMHMMMKGDHMTKGDHMMKGGSMMKGDHMMKDGSMMKDDHMMKDGMKKDDMKKMDSSQ